MIVRSGLQSEEQAKKKCFDPFKIQFNCRLKMKFKFVFVTFL